MRDARRGFHEANDGKKPLLAKLQAIRIPNENPLSFTVPGVAHENMHSKFPAYFGGRVG
jgi:hypothetical protein